MKNKPFPIIMLALLSALFWSSLTACTPKTEPSSKQNDETSHAENQQEARGVKQTPLSNGPKLQNHL